MFSPDGKSISFLVSDDPPRCAGYRRIAVIPAEGGAPRLLAETFDAQPGVMDWSNDGKGLYFLETRGTVSRLATIDVASGAITDLNKGNEVLGAVSLNNSRSMIGFTMQSSDKAPEDRKSTRLNSSHSQISYA